MIEIQTTEYLSQLLKDKKQLGAFPNVFNHLERLLDEGNYNFDCLFYLKNNQELDDAINLSK